MGDAPKRIARLERSPEEIRQDERQWYLDPQEGDLLPEALPEEDPRLLSKPISVPRMVID